MALITVTELEARGITGSDARLQAAIDDVSAEVVDFVARLDSNTDDPIAPADWNPTTVPAAVKAVVARVIRRDVTNPLARSGEQLGDHNWQAPSAASGGTLGPKDCRQIRRAIGLGSGVSVALGSYLPLPAEYDDTLNELV